MDCEGSGLNEGREQGNDCFIRNAIAESVPVGTVKEKAEGVFVMYYYGGRYSSSPE